MKIQVEGSCCHKGDVYKFTWDFEHWLGAALGKCVEASEAFAKKHGQDWTLFFGWDTGKRIKKPTIAGPWIDRESKEKRWQIELPWFRYTSADPKAYVPMLRQFLEGVVAVLVQEQIKASKLEQRTEALLKQFVSRCGMIEYDPHPYTFGTPGDPYGLKKKAIAAKTPKPETKARVKFAKGNLPKWKIPAKIRKHVEDEGGLWEDERFDPVLLTVLSGNSYKGREIPLTWQIEFDPFDERLATASEKIRASGIEPDGDGWSQIIEKEFARRHARLASEFHSDSESSTCVIWVESGRACRRLIELVWSLIHPVSK